MNKCGCQGRCSCGRGYSGYPHVWEKNDPWDKTLDNIPKINRLNMMPMDNIPILILMIYSLREPNELSQYLFH